MKTLLLIDANSLIHRSFHALPPFTGPEGQPTGALYGLANILLKIVREEPPANGAGRPDFIAAFFDRPEPTFRKEIFEEYKIHRPKTPDELVLQLKEAHELFQKFNIKTFEAPGFEADDLIGAATHKFQDEPDLRITILTGDLDTLQLVKNDKIVVRVFKKGVSETVTYNEAAVVERYGISPRALPDYKGLIGDSSDNIPGVSGVGPKTASRIIKKYGSLEDFLKRGQKEKPFEKILSAKEQVLLSRRLARISDDAPFTINNLTDLGYSGASKSDLSQYFEKFGFKSLAKRVGSPNRSSPPVGRLF